MPFITPPGWANTNKNGLKFESQVNFLNSICNIDGYSVEDNNIFFENQKVAEYYKSHDFYKNFLEPKWVNWRAIISKQLLPDTAIYVLRWNTVYIIEVKYQWWVWSVDEKLQTGRFKKMQYNRLLQGTWLHAEFCFVLADYFLHPKYKDALNFILAEDCKYFFWEVPLDYLWLPSA